MSQHVVNFADDPNADLRARFAAYRRRCRHHVKWSSMSTARNSVSPPRPTHPIFSFGTYRASKPDVLEMVAMFRGKNRDVYRSHRRDACRFSEGFAGLLFAETCVSSRARLEAANPFNKGRALAQFDAMLGRVFGVAA